LLAPVAHTLTSHAAPETVCNVDCRLSLESALAALHACLEHGVKKGCSFAAVFGGVIPGLRVPPAGVAGEEEREKIIVVGWLKRAIVQGETLLPIVSTESKSSPPSGSLIMFLESINRKWADKLAASYGAHALLRDSEAMLLLTGTLIGVCTSDPVKAAASAAASPSPSSSPSIEAGAGRGAFTIEDARVRLVQAETAKVWAEALCMRILTNSFNAARAGDRWCADSFTPGDVELVQRQQLEN
jgi:hypothetical protein